MRVIKLRPASIVVALSRRDTEALLDLLVESQAEWEDGIANGHIERGDSPYWEDGTGDRIAQRLSEAYRSFTSGDRPAS